MTAAFPTVLVSRRPRRQNAEWWNASSWLGGAPRIGAEPWPRDKSGLPLVFVAQIDLADVATVTGKTPLPDAGSLAFFVGRDGVGKVIPVSHRAAPTRPPHDMPDLIDYGGSQDWRTDLSGLPLFPYWPVAFHVLDLPEPPRDEDADDDDVAQDYAAAEAAAVGQHIQRRQYNLSPAQAFAGPPIPNWWHTAVYYADYLDKALRNIPNIAKGDQAQLAYARGQVDAARAKTPDDLRKAQAYVALCEKKIAERLHLEPDLIAFAADVAGLSAGRDRWSMMEDDDLARLAALWSRNSEFAAFHHNMGKFALDYLQGEMFKALPAAGTDAYRDLPAHVREVIDARRAPRPNWWFMAIHYAKRLREALQISVPSATKYRLEKIAGYRKKIAAVQPNSGLAVFKRMFGQSTPEVAKLEAEIVKVEAELAQLAGKERSFAAFVEDTQAWTRDRDPWARMQSADIAELDARMKRAQDAFPDFARYTSPRRIEDIEAATLIAMATAEDRGYAALPASVRSHIDNSCLLPPDVWHQMFGRAVEIQGESSAMREDGYVLLLQLTYDDLMHWSFGDNGAYQFWISPADIAKRNWAGVKLTFECH